MASFNDPGYPIIIEEQSDNHPQKTSGNEVINRKRTLTSESEDDKFVGDEQHDDIKTVLDGKSKNIKTEDGIKRRKTPLEPGLSSAIKNNVPEDDKFLDELHTETETDHKIHLNPKSSSPDPPPFRLQRLKMVYDHDHNICVASELGFAYGELIPGRYAKYFDKEAMVPKKSSAQWKLDFDADYDPWKTPRVKPSGYPQVLPLPFDDEDPQSPPSEKGEFEELFGI